MAAHLDRKSKLTQLQALAAVSRVLIDLQRSTKQAIN